MVSPEDRTAGTTVGTLSALVTGAAHGIGLEVARQLAASGVRVLVAGRDAAQAARAVADVDGVTALSVDLDIADPVAVSAAAHEIAERGGRLDVLVNNAAAHPEFDETATNADLERSAAAFQVTLFGTWRVTQALLPLLRQSAHPRIVNVSSGAGSHADRYGIPHNGGAFATHGISKAALNAFTATLAAELADTPLIVNAVCPGVTVADPADGPPGARSFEQSAPGVVWAALLPDDGPRGGFFRDGEPIDW